MPEFPNRFLIAAALMLTTCLAGAAASVEVRPELRPAPAAQSTINIQNNEGASCASPAIGRCGNCSVSCPAEKAAVCKPGLTVGDPDSLQSSCIQPPECHCR